MINIAEDCPNCGTPIQRSGFAILVRRGIYHRAGEYVCPHCKVKVCRGGNDGKAPLSFIQFDDGERLDTSGVIK